MISAINHHTKLLELLALSLAVSIYAVLSGTGAIDISTQIYLTVGWLILLLVLSWKQSEGGMHPVFFFLALLLLFQGGRLLAYCLHGSSFDPMRIDFGSSFDITLAQQRTSLLALVLSSLAIFMPMRVFDSRVRYQAPENLDLLPWLLALFLFTLPFHAYKNYEYFSYVRSHGGYLAIFQTTEHLEQAGFTARALSQVCSAAFIVYFCYERPRLRMALITLAYLSVSVVELLIGLRGKVFLFTLCLLFLWKLKRHTHFRLRSLAIIAIILAFVGQATAIFRENQSSSVTALDVPLAFLAGQGISFNVTETMVAFRPHFAESRWSYLTHLESISRAQSDTTRGQSMQDDMSLFLDPAAFQVGFGTGGTFLAEGFLYGGLPGVVVESLLVGVLLVIVSRNFRGALTPFAWMFMLTLLYLPRQDLLSALVASIRDLMVIGLVLLLAYLGTAGARSYRSAATA